MNKARAISFTVIFLFVSLFSFSATYKKASSSDEPAEKTKYRVSTGIGLNLLHLFMLRPVRQDTTVLNNQEPLIRPSDDAVVPEKED